MNRQARAQIQPILEIDINVGKDEFLPKGTFIVKNIGAQPALIRHARMTCRRDTIVCFTSSSPRSWFSRNLKFRNQRFNQRHCKKEKPIRQTLDFSPVYEDLTCPFQGATFDGSTIGGQFLKKIRNDKSAS